MQQNANLQFLHRHCLPSPTFSRNSTAHFLITKTGSTAGGFLFCTAGFFRYLHRIIISELLEIIPRHIPCDKLPDWCPAAVRRRSGDAVAPQLARYAVVDVVRSGSQP